MTKKELLHIISQGENEQVEFKSSFNKAVFETVVAFSNTTGGVIIIGCNDKKEIIGVSVTDETAQKWINEIKQNTLPQIIADVNVVKINTKTIIVLIIAKYPVKPVSYKSKYFKRILNSNHLMNLEEVSNLHLKTINSSWDYYPDNGHTIEHISIDKIKTYISAYEEKHNSKVDYTEYEFLNKLEFFRENKLTYGAYLLFVEDYCSISDIQIGRFKSDITIIDTISLNTDLFTELNQIIAFIKKHLMVELIITGEPRHIERYDYPLEAIREIVINMIVHRDYKSSNGSIIKIYDDRIEFYNPGGLFGDLSLEKLLAFNYSSQTRNKLIAKAFKEIGIIEKYGSGIKRIFSICEKHSIIKPKINIGNNSFELILYKEKLQVGDKVGDRVGDKVGDNLTDNQLLIIKYIRQNNKISANELSKEIGISARKIEENIKKLKEKIN